MRPSFDITSITSRIDQIRRSTWMPTREIGSVAFSDRLASAVAAQRTPGVASSGGASMAPSQRLASTDAPVYYTLGGVPVPSSLIDTAANVVGDWVPARFEGEISDWAAALPEQGRALAGSIDAAATAAGIDPRLLASVVWAESAFVPDAVSSAGAIGLAQLMPGTAQGLGVDPWDPQQNLNGGAKYLATQIDRFGSVSLGLAAYNAGPGRVIEHGGAPSYTEAYISRVLGYYEQLGGSR